MSRKSYKDAGVDIDAGNAMIDAIKPYVRSTQRTGTLGDIGGFGGLFDLKATGYTDPMLVAATDGVGTKLKVAFTSGIHDSIGIDLVAMCVNDLVVQGAEPLFFLDYFATGRLDPQLGAEIVKGIATGCKLAGCALIGGETAEMPGLYNPGDYDLAGFAVGAVEREQIIDGSAVKEGDVILGLSSNGLHSNGYSLVRKVIADQGIDYDDPAPFAPDLALQDILLAPTRIYVKSCLDAIKQGGVHALAHITGGGLLENLPRVYNDDLAASLTLNSLKVPHIFRWLSKAGDIDGTEMLRTFNCGIGMALFVDAQKVQGVRDVLSRHGEKVIEIGQVKPRRGGKAVTFSGFDLT